MASLVSPDSGHPCIICADWLIGANHARPGAVRLYWDWCAYGIAASLAFPDRPVLVATGDGACGFNSIEVDTAVRH
jgi:Thiamine pyrophosphate enzyme, C-terminal TPP binding domain